MPLYLDKKSETLKVLQQLRDEAHRFGITFHRNKRSENFTKSELISIPGVGDKTVEKLLIALKSVDHIKKTGLESIELIVGKDKGRKVFDYFNHS